MKLNTNNKITYKNNITYKIKKYITNTNINKKYECIINKYVNDNYVINKNMQKDNDIEVIVNDNEKN